MRALFHSPDYAKPSWVWGLWSFKGHGRKVTRSTVGVQRVWLGRLRLPLVDMCVFYEAWEGSQQPSTMFQTQSPNLVLFSFQVPIIFLPAFASKSITAGNLHGQTLLQNSLWAETGTLSGVVWNKVTRHLSFQFLLSSSANAMLAPMALHIRSVLWRVC